MSVTVDEGHQGEKSEWKPSESEYVGWAVALHRFLVKQWGVDPAPSLVGKYVSGIKRPANNVAIQILDSELKSSYGIQLRDDVARKLPGFLIMLPKDMPQHDMQKLYDVCKRSKGKRTVLSQACSKACDREVCLDRCGTSMETSKRRFRALLDASSSCHCGDSTDTGLPRKSVIGELPNQCIWHWAMYGVISMFPMIFRVRGNRGIGRRWMQLLISLLISEYSIADG